MTFAEHLRSYRLQKGYTQAQFGAILGLASDRIGVLERDVWPYTLSRPLQERLAAVLGCPVEALGLRSRPRRPHRLARYARPQGVTLGLLLARRRSRLGLTQEALAERLHVDRTVISRWEHDRSRPSPPMRMRLARALACSLDDMIAGD